MNKDEKAKINSRRLLDVPNIAVAFLKFGSGSFSFFHSGGTANTKVVPHCNKATAFQNEIHVVRASPAS
jgi:hypothetical protein